MHPQRFRKGLYPAVALLTLVFAFFSLHTASAQTTIQSGSIQGAATDDTGAVVPDAQVTITSKATNQRVPTRTNSAGVYNSGSLLPGDYVVRVEKQGFRTIEMPVTVLVGTTSNGAVHLKPGEVKEVITVESSQMAVNTQQATVQGVLTEQQIENLPINGRNFLELAQLEPGVQIQEGSTFDPTKNGFSSISFGGRFGRTARIEIDGVDISDETVGTTTQNIPASAIQEFQLEQSSLDLGSELTSSGEVNVTTKHGTNVVHGTGFGLFRDRNAASASLPGAPDAPFQREQYGGSLGGPLLKNKLFWEIAGEHAKQDLAAPQAWAPIFSALNGNLGEPFREGEVFGRLDWTISDKARMFYRFLYDQNSDARAFGAAASFQPFFNHDNTPSHTVGLDWNTGTFTHSIRFEYLKFRNGIGDATAGQTGPVNPVPGIGININAIAGLCIIAGGDFCAGPNFLAPQQTFQSDKQVKYDGSKTFGKHTLRYGVTFNHIQGGGLAAFVTFPQVGTNVPIPGITDPTLEPVQWASLGNGVGFSTANPAFNLPAGGLGPDNRIEWYFGDAWRLKPNFTVTAAIRYVRDTGRTDTSLGPIPALNFYGAGLGDAVRTPGTNFAPQLGLAWDIKGNGKTVIRAGGGLYYENSIWNNVLFDSPARLTSGVFLQFPLVCAGGAPLPFTWPVVIPAGPVAGGAGTSDGAGNVSPNFCSNSNTIAGAASQILALSGAYQSAAAGAGAQPNANFVGNTLTAFGGNGLDLFAPNYRTPRSWQMNVGVEHEFRRGVILDVDYVRNIEEFTLLAIDVNHTGAARFYNQVNATTARDAVQGPLGCGTAAGGAACVVAALGQAGAQAAYSSAGLDSGIAVTGGAPCSTCAFPGMDLTGTHGAVSMLFPVGRAVYNGLQTKLRVNMNNPMPGVKGINLQLSYSLSRYTAPVTDGDFITNATNQDNPNQFTGPNALDRTHQFSFGAVFNLPWFTQMSFIGHFYSPLPQSLLLPQLTSGGEIFATDWLGSGNVNSSVNAGEPVPGTQIGDFGRGVNAGNLQGVINNYNSNMAGTLTPAGQQVVSSGVMTLADMQALGWVMPTLPNVPQGAMNFPWLKTFDMKFAWPIKVGERFRIEPSIGMFNIFNFANEFLPGNLPSPVLNADPNNPAQLSPSGVGGVTPASLLPFRASMQSGTNALGAPRQLEFGLKITF